jgi:hypothetical protein
MKTYFIIKKTVNGLEIVNNEPINESEAILISKNIIKLNETMYIAEIKKEISA